MKLHKNLMFKLKLYIPACLLMMLFEEKTVLRQISVFIVFLICFIIDNIVTNLYIK